MTAPDVPNDSNVIDMQARIRSIREAREARAKRRAEQQERPAFPGGIDDMDL